MTDKFVNIKLFDFDLPNVDFSLITVKEEPLYYDDCNVFEFDESIKLKRTPCAAPLDELSDSRLNIHAFRTLKLRPDEDWEEAMTWITSDRIWHECIQNIPSMAPYKTARGFLATDMDMLKSSGIISKRKSVGLGYSTLFKVHKRNGLSRLILNCAEVNARTSNPLNMGLPKIHDVLDKLLNKNFLVQFDGQAYFYQFPLSGGAEKCFTFAKATGRRKYDTYALNVLPMGFKHAPRIAQLTSNLIIRNVLKDSLTSVGFAWVDNFIFAGDTMDELSRIIQSFKTVAETVNLKYKQLHDPSHEADLLGLHVNLSSKTITPSEEHVAIYHERFNTEIHTNRWYAGVAGHYIWMAYTVLRLPLSNVHRMLFTLSNIGRDIALGLSNWSSPLNKKYDITTLPEKESFTRARYIHTARVDTSSFTVWSDASLEGAGVIAQGHACLRGWAWSDPNFHKCQDIFLKELLVAAQAVASAPSDSSILLVTDNQGVYNTLRKGSSRSYIANEIMNTMMTVSGSKSRLSIAWVPSQANLADGLSRGTAVCASSVHFPVPLHKVSWCFPESKHEAMGEEAIQLTMIHKRA